MDDVRVVDEVLVDTAHHPQSARGAPRRQEIVAGTLPEDPPDGNGGGR